MRTTRGYSRSGIYKTLYVYSIKVKIKKSLCDTLDKSKSFTSQFNHYSGQLRRPHPDLGRKGGEEVREEYVELVDSACVGCVLGPTSLRKLNFFLHGKIERTLVYYCSEHCFRSGSASGSVCFCASWIRIR
jgi:hypothetical protein